MNPKDKLKFFIVDDDVFIASVYEQYLKNIDYTDVTCYTSGEDCLDSLVQKPDIIFLDYNMDDLNGFEVLKKIKRYNPNIYVVIISGQEDINVAVEALKHGAFDYLVKNGSAFDRMTETIDRIIRIQEEIANSRGGRGLFGFFKIF